MNLDPHPDNLLGKNVLPAEQEAKLLAEGVIFATFVTPENPKVPPFLVTCKRSIIQSATDALTDAYRTVHRLRSQANFAPTEFIPS